MAYLQINGLNIWCERRGDGAPLLFISGTGGDLRRKPSVMDGPLPKVFDTVAYDQRGLGQSDKPDGPYSMADYADDAAAVLDELDWARAHVVGVSFGGMVAQNLAVRHPGRIERLVLCCTSPGGEGGSSYPLHTLGDLQPEARARHMIPVSDRRRDAAWAAAHPDQYEMLVRMAAEDPWAGEPRRQLGAALQLQARAGHDVWDRLPEIDVPTLICAGRHDDLAPPAAQEAMASRIRGSQLRWYEGGHMFLLEDRSAFPDIIAFLGGGA
jgi:3-oxoadipate enol-lactonase